jgi:tetratricopeptide (TPR) repeat protein
MMVLLSAQDMSTMNAVQLNTAGFQLYEAGKFEESLKYFKASFEKNPDYSYPHYNYACVLSILKRGKDEITEHLLKSFFIEPKFREKYFSDPDLEWFRKDPVKGNRYADYFQFEKYRTDINAGTAYQLLLGDKNSISYIMAYPVTTSRPYADSRTEAIEFFSSGTVQMIDDSGSTVQGRYTITGNVVYVELDPGNNLRLESGSIPLRKFIWRLDSDKNDANEWHGCVLLSDSLYPIDLMRSKEYYGPGANQGV